MNGNLARMSILSCSFLSGATDSTNCNASRQELILTPRPANLESIINESASCLLPTSADIIAFDTAVRIGKLEKGSDFTVSKFDLMYDKRDSLFINFGNSLAMTFSDEEWHFAVEDFDLWEKSTIRVNNSWLLGSMCLILHKAYNDGNRRS